LFKSRPAFPHNNMQSQRGVALILFFLVILLSGAIFMVTNVSRDDARIDNEEKTTQALAKAKQALIAFAVTYHDGVTGSNDLRAGLMGFLPCPEYTGSTEGRSLGACGSQYDSFLGRLPWRSLGIEPIKDGSGACLWYAVSSEYKNSGRLDRNNLSNSADGLSRTEMLNDDSNGSFQLLDRNGKIIKGAQPQDRVVAIIIAPGRALPGQIRTFNNETQCGADFDKIDFLEVFNGVNNAAITTGLPNDHIDVFIASHRSNDDTFNDRIITISQQEIFNEIKKRKNFDTLINNTTQALAECIAQFGLNNLPFTGGCNLDDCLGDCDDTRGDCRDLCNDARGDCRDQCDNALSDCRDQCDINEEACLEDGGSQGSCRAINRACTRACIRTRNDCRSVCNPTRNSCREVCDAASTACTENCNTNCTVDGGGGIGGNDYRLPWPAAMDLDGGDYRDSIDYIEAAPDTIHLGRFPVDISSSAAETNNTGGQYLLENNYCSALPISGINLNTTPPTNSIERRIWQNWKDHFFYAVSTGFDSGPANRPTPTACNAANCLEVDGTRFAGVVFFAGERINNQVRNAAPDADTKNIIGNYLEGDNINNDTIYETRATNPAVNDSAYCIDENMNVRDCR
jgi:hypothetical protein